MHTSKKEVLYIFNYKHVLKMKKKLLLSFMLLAAFVIVQRAQGQEKDEQFGKIGLGMAFLSVSDFSFYNEYNGGNLIYVPINIKEKYRIEPEVAIIFNSNDKQISLGTGLFKLKRNNNLLLHYGVRLGYWSSGAIYFTPAIGGEYFISKRFSIGAEQQFRIVTDVDSYYGSTNTKALIRYYFK